MKTPLIGLALATLLAACSTSAPPPGQGDAPDLEDTDWRVISVVGIDQPVGARVSFSEDGIVSGNTGCNDFTGRYRLDGSSLEIGPVAVTRKACAGPAGDTERAFLSALEATRGAAVVRKDLVWVDADDMPLARLNPL